LYFDVKSTVNTVPNLDDNHLMYEKSGKP
jgi:hypothetical protein